MKEPVERSLDPQDWQAFRRLAHRALDDALDMLATVPERPVWRSVPEAVRAEFKTPLPQKGVGAEAAYEDYQRLVAPYPLGNIHPRFWGWVIGTGTPMGVVADMLAAALNPNCSDFDHSAAFVELQVIEWLKEMLGFPKQASGLLVSGGSVANLSGINVARNARAPFAVREQGLTQQARLTLYASTETHNSVQKAAELMGLGSRSLVKIPVDSDYRIDVAALKARIAADREAGLVPFCVVANAGTVNTGAVDDLDAIADLCRDEQLWLHVDGAFGALAALDPEGRTLVKGMERADSLAFDLHKWMYLPFEAGCVLVRQRDRHQEAFAAQASYLKKLEGGVANGVLPDANFGPQLSRGFRALKVWMNLKAYGAEEFARLISQNLAQAQYLKARVEREPELELLAPVPMNVVNFRYRGKGLAAEALEELNPRILVALQERGIAVPSQTVLGGRFAIRVAITNHRSRREDFDALADAVLALGRELQ
ncbi:MAG TPA: aminotransferase class V-fold PLP-dependent enzyme [Gammaproteobacteria bacterium]|jgi:glutamate/tyrosine decarboxylase-like PLP-dependent enzyme